MKKRGETISPAAKRYDRQTIGVSKWLVRKSILNNISVKNYCIVGINAWVDKMAIEIPYRREYIKKIIEERTKILEPDQCAIFYDEKKGLLISARNTRERRVEIELFDIKSMVKERERRIERMEKKEKELKRIKERERRIERMEKKKEEKELKRIKEIGINCRK